MYLILHKLVPTLHMLSETFAAYSQAALPVGSSYASLLCQGTGHLPLLPIFSSDLGPYCVTDTLEPWNTGGQY